MSFGAIGALAFLTLYFVFSSFENERQLHDMHDVASKSRIMELPVAVFCRWLQTLQKPKGGTPPGKSTRQEHEPALRRFLME